MRFLLVSAFAVLAFSACIIGNEPGSASSGSSTGDAGAVCDGKKDCMTCVACAEQNPCSMLYTACSNNSVCQSIAGCWSACGSNTSCRQDCLTNNPDGASDFNALLQCDYCTQCPSDCAGFQTCN
jgi:hypothetical protein